MRKLRNLFLDEKTITVLLIFWTSLIIYFVFGKRGFNIYNNYSYLADAVLHGRIDTPNIPDYLESISFRGHTYMHFAPGCSWLSIPFVMIWGVDGFNCAILTKVLAALNATLAYLVLSKMNIGKSDKDRLYMTVMLTLGTVHFWCASMGASWYLGHVATIFFLLLSLLLLLDAINCEETVWSYYFLSGLFFGWAVNCRLSALFGGIFFVYLIYKKHGFSIKPYILFALGAAILGSVYMIYNYVRYGTIMDEGYSLTYLKDYHREQYDIIQNSPVEQQRMLLKKYKKECGGPLQLKFIKYNLYSILFMAPRFSWDKPYLVPDVSGVAITFTSPMLYLAILAHKRKDLVMTLWITIVLTAIPFLMNYGNGMSQFGMRYSLDFTPYLWLLMCIGLSDTGKMKYWMKMGIILCVGMNLWGVLYWIRYY